MNDVTEEFYCDCPLVEEGGFMGVHCETPFLECTTDDDDSFKSWRCYNGGLCNSGDSPLLCQCPDEFVGFMCEIFSGPSEVLKGAAYDDGQFPVAAIFIMATASLVLSLACFLGGFHVGRGKRSSVEFDSNFGEQSDSSLQLEVGNTKPEVENPQLDDEAPEFPKDSEIT